jgi:acyl-CoA synthetase (AMP-forming)/AMP-acid ligase II
VSAKEVEDAISEIPEVVEVAVVGAPHELLGESIVAFIVTSRGADISERDVLAHCQKRLPASKCPHEVVFLRELPHNNAGKILKAELKAGLNHPGTVQGSAGGKTEKLRANQNPSHCAV